jgi:hypothetical protein
MNIKYTIEDIATAVQNSSNWAEVCLKLSGRIGGQSAIKARAVAAGISFDHFLGQSWSKGKTLGPKYSLDYYLVKGGAGINSSDLRKRLIEEGLKTHSCEECKLGQWNGVSIPLELHHVNGDRKDNRFSNLKVLCCNCHALTDNYGAKNRRVAQYT